MIEILNIWIKIIGIVILWEVWKYFAWEAINWWIDKQIDKHSGGK